MPINLFDFGPALVWFLVVLLCLVSTARKSVDLAKIPRNRFWTQVIFSVIGAFYNFGREALFAGFTYFLSACIMILVMYLIEREKQRILSAWKN